MMVGCQGGYKHVQGFVLKRYRVAGFGVATFDVMLAACCYYVYGHWLGVEDVPNIIMKGLAIESNEHEANNWYDLQKMKDVLR